MWSLLSILVFLACLIINVATFNHHYLQDDALHRPHGHIHTRSPHLRGHNSEHDAFHIPHGHIHTRATHVRRRISDNNSHPKVLNDLHNLEGCSGEICGTLSGDAVAPLLAGAAECAQQDMADRIIDEAKSKVKDPKVQKEMIRLAIEYRKTERNSFPDYSHQPPTDRNSLYCQKQPKNSELNGVFQAQSPQADPNLFFDPKSTTGGGNVKKGSDPRTIPFGNASTTTGMNTTTGSNTTTTVDSSAANTTSSGASESSSDSMNTTALANSDATTAPMMNFTQSSCLSNVTNSTDEGEPTSDTLDPMNTTAVDDGNGSDEKSDGHE
ncbi:uncharacterized protein MELLADRAFT_64418 [Melampsora larici-populina 98AG31]|uniref:Secreted protein n=1 Tax=Melampsora larici-populina (strain 98AG31 / pathotype 3-4-7) TaxID=747676 RepID=F4RRD3_MELLP|nr:uncharacterized protein MELLADRAFT_64418 [Melampsora larici-populina 98AG31]EGG04917.1 hypothetical protein MELLADRAFT_64418 [Melampsora larici-populina 98AG31]